MKPTIYLWTGEGWGKSTSAFGTAVRSIGHGKKVVIVQFMKGWKERIGEYKFFKDQPLCDIEQFGSAEWVDLDKPSKEDKERAQKGLAYAKEKLQEKPFLLILDEVNIAVSCGLLTEDEVLNLLNNVQHPVHIYLTGRGKPKKLLAKADFVNEITMLKGPKDIQGEEGIDY